MVRPVTVLNSSPDAVRKMTGVLGLACLMALQTANPLPWASVTSSRARSKGQLPVPVARAMASSCVTQVSTS